MSVIKERLKMNDYDRYKNVNINRFYPNERGEFELILGALVFACLDGAYKQAESECNDTDEAIDYYTKQRLKYYIGEACGMIVESPSTKDFVKNFLNSRDIELIYKDEDDE
jgi:hypothetical protein